MSKPRITSARSGLESVEITSWNQFQALVTSSDYRSWAFRGQADASWPLYSSLSRHLHTFGVHPEACAAQEDRCYRIFQRKAHLFLNKVPAEDDAFQWLALMQHHGAPTRLLDFTWSPLVAAFFALEKAQGDAAVWALSLPRIWSASYRFPKLRKRLTPDHLSLRHPGNYQRYFVGNDVPFVVTGEPHIMNQRLIAQAGTFVVPGVVDVPVDEILAQIPASSSLLVKFVLRTERIRDEAMYTFYNMNITNATLFPDLDGLARSLAYELEYHWAYNPKTLERYKDY